MVFLYFATAVYNFFPTVSTGTIQKFTFLLSKGQFFYSFEILCKFSTFKFAAVHLTNSFWKIKEAAIFDHENAYRDLPDVLKMSYQKTSKTFMRIFPASNEVWTPEKIDQLQSWKSVQKLPPTCITNLIHSEKTAKNVNLSLSRRVFDQNDNCFRFFSCSLRKASL